MRTLKEVIANLSEEASVGHEPSAQERHHIEALEIIEARLAVLEAKEEQGEHDLGKKVPRPTSHDQVQALRPRA